MGQLKDQFKALQQQMASQQQTIKTTQEQLAQREGEVRWHTGNFNNMQTQLQSQLQVWTWLPIKRNC